MTLNQAAAENGDAEPLHQLRVASACGCARRSSCFRSHLCGGQLKICRRRHSLDLGTRGRGARMRRNVGAAQGSRGENRSRSRRIYCTVARGTRRAAKIGHAVLYEMLASKRFRSLTAKVSRPAIKKIGGDRTLGAAAAQLVRLIARSAMRFGSELDNHAPAAAFHKLRVRIKRLRYALRDAQVARRQAASKGALAALEELQECARDVSRRHGSRRHGCVNMRKLPLRRRKTILAAGGLIQLLARREAKLRRRCVKAWRRFERSEAMRDALEEIRRAVQAGAKAW